ncbi:MAG: hypothetical protein ACLFVJ_14430 [Persicimonas sp.]
MVEENSDNTNSEGARAGSLEQDVRALRTLLAKTGRAWRRPMLLEGLLWYLVTLGAVVLSCFLVAALVPAAVGAFTGWMLIVGVSAASVGAVAAWVGFERQKGDVEQIAVMLQRHNRGLRNDLVAALEFGQRLLDPDAEHFFSVEMARAHVKKTVRDVLSRCEHGHLAHLLPQRSLTAPAMSLAGCLALVLLPFGLDTQWSIDVLTSPLAGAEHSADASSEQRPVVGNLFIYYSTPPYTGIGRKVDAYSTGYVETMVGTDVAIEAQSLIADARQVELILETSEGTRSIVMEPTDESADSKLRGSFVALESGTYHFKATLDDGTVIEDGTERKIDLRPDESPAVNITSHSGQIEVSPDDTLDIEFDVSDDFGLTEVSRVWQFAGDGENASKKELELPELTNKPRETSGEISFDLAPLGLQPKDVVVFYIEAKDNNTLTGPGVGQSKRLELRVSSPEDKHLQNIADQQRLLEELLGLLADYLEAPMGEREARSDDTWRQTVSASGPAAAQPAELAGRLDTLEEVQDKQSRIIEEMGELLEKLEQDPLMRERDYTHFEALDKRLTRVHEEGQSVFERAGLEVENGELSLASAQPVANYAAGAEDTLEKGILRFEDLLASQKMDAIKQTSEDIKELKERLKELLERYKETNDPELKEAIKRDIQRLRQRMAELMQRMQMQLEKLPQEHMNMEAVKQQQLDSDTQKMTDSLSKIEDMLENDDIDGALEALEQMDMNLDSLTQDMDEQFAEAEPQGLSELDKKVSELMDELNDVQQAEKDLEGQTAELNEQLAEKRREEMEQMLDEFQNKMEQKVEQQKKALDKMDDPAMQEVHRDGLERSKQAVEELEEMVEQQDVESGLEKARDALRAHQRMRNRLDLSQRYSNSEDQKREIDELRGKNDGVEDRGREIVEDIEDMMDEAQERLGQQENQRMDQLAERQRQISEQAEQLEQQIGEASKQFPMLQEQLGEPMQKSREAMKEASEGLDGRRSQRALDAERSALEQLGNLKQQMQKSVQKQRRDQRENGREVGREDVDIPGQSNEEGGQRLRDDVMDAMKEEKLDSYESEIERYYKSIME